MNVEIRMAVCGVCVNTALTINEKPTSTERLLMMWLDMVICPVWVKRRATVGCKYGKAQLAYFYEWRDG